MQTPSTRLHALDNLRAVMMWLGIVIHVAVMHMEGPAPTNWHDPATTRLADLLVAFIHVFRMPVFFIVAGFFVAMLIETRGPAAMLKHRFQRIALPFLLFWPLLLVSAALALLVHAHVAARGTVGLDPALLPPPPPGRPLINTMHLWFIYLLWWFAAGTAALAVMARRLPASWQAAAARQLQRLSGAWWGPLVLVLPLLVASLGHLNGLLAPHGSLLPHWSEWLHNGLFFAVGLALYGARAVLLPLYARRAWWCVALGLPFFGAAMVLGGLRQRGVAVPHADLWMAAVYNLASWWWSAAAIGLFLRYLPVQRPALAYLSGSAYWVYLVHLPLTIAFGAALLHAPLGALVKMLLNIGLTTAVSLASYQLLVRGRWIGRLLNGATVQRRAAPAAVPLPGAAR
jgi:peptidoglycan/LPS O-acetylase OafA/YrhL